MELIEVLGEFVEYEEDYYELREDTGIAPQEPYWDENLCECKFMEHGETCDYCYDYQLEWEAWVRS